MKIELVGWKSRGLRCPDVNINLCNETGSVDAIALLQAPNGTGKTTTLQMLKACMHGEAKSWSAEKIRSYKRAGDSKSEGLFITELKIDERPLTIELRLNFDEGWVNYSTTTPGSGGQVMGWDPPVEARKFFDKRFLNLFIFDGEYAASLLNQNESEAEYAIDALCQLYLLKDIEMIANTFWEKSARQSSVRTTVGLNAEYRKRDEISNRIAHLRENKSKAIQKLQHTSEEVNRYQKLVDEKLSTETKTREQFRRVQEKFDEAKSYVNDYSFKLSQSIRKPNALHPKISYVLLGLKDNLDKLKLPENTSSQFFEELIHSQECICGREMTTDAAEHIRVRSKDYLGEREIGIINEIKADIEKYVSSDREINPYEDLIELRDYLGKYRIDMARADQQLRALENQLIGEGDSDLETWKIKLQNLKEEQNKLNEFLKKLEEDVQDLDFRNSFSLPFLERKLKEIDIKISEITQTIDIKNRTDILKGILQEIYIRAQKRIKSDLLQICNQRLKDVLINDTLQISGIERSLKLSNQEGASEGQTLSVGYVFLMSILNRGNNIFPLVVDSPAGKLSSEVRKQIGSLIPTLCNQFIAFTIDTERSSFVTSLESSRRKIKFMTVFRKTEGTTRLMNDLPEIGVEQTESSVLITGREYFFKFTYNDGNI